MPKYNSIDTIPAKVFFQILETKNYQLLKPKNSEKGLEQIFIAIYDEFFIKSDNEEAKRYLELNKNIAFLRYKIAVIKQTLAFIYYSTTTREMRLETIKALNDGCGLDINFDVDFKEEVERILTQNIGWLENDLAFDEIELKELIGKRDKKVFDYEERIVAMEQNLKRNIQDKLTLAKYIALEKLELKIVMENNKKVA